MNIDGESREELKSTILTYLDTVEGIKDQLMAEDYYNDRKAMYNLGVLHESLKCFFFELTSEEEDE